MQKVKKVEAQGREFYMPVISNKKQNYLSRHAAKIDRVLGNLQNESTITE